jgi:hypothetical protein
MGTGIFPLRMRHIESPDFAVIVCRKLATEAAFSWHFSWRFLSFLSHFPHPEMAQDKGTRCRRRKQTVIPCARG